MRHNKGQQFLEYILLIAAVAVVCIIFLKPEPGNPMYTAVNGVFGSLVKIPDAPVSVSKDEKGKGEEKCKAIKCKKLGYNCGGEDGCSCGTCPDGQTCSSSSGPGTCILIGIKPPPKPTMYICNTSMPYTSGGLCGYSVCYADGTFDTGSPICCCPAGKSPTCTAPGPFCPPDPMTGQPHCVIDRMECT